MSEHHQVEYLGDGLYAEYDGFMVILRTQRMEGEHWVGLEPDVFRALLEFKHRIDSGLAERKADL